MYWNNDLIAVVDNTMKFNNNIRCIEIDKVIIDSITESSLITT